MRVYCPPIPPCGVVWAFFFFLSQASPFELSLSRIVLFPRVGYIISRHIRITRAFPLRPLPTVLSHPHLLEQLLSPPIYYSLASSELLEHFLSAHYPPLSLILTCSSNCSPPDILLSCLIRTTRAFALRPLPTSLSHPHLLEQLLSPRYITLMAHPHLLEQLLSPRYITLMAQDCSSSCSP